VTPDEMQNQFLLDMKRALIDAQERKWLGQQRHGYCFTCERETLVYDVIAEGSPVQPPKCEECFIDGAIDFLESPRASGLIKEFLNNESEETE
jgi:hypothetical protein